MAAPISRRARLTRAGIRRFIAALQREEGWLTSNRTQAELAPRLGGVRPDAVIAQKPIDLTHFSGAFIKNVLR
jgi:hypothetical protein